MTVRVGYLVPPIPSGGYYFPRTSRRGPQRTRRSGFALAPNYRFLGQDTTPPPTTASAVPAGTVLSYTASWGNSPDGTIGWNHPNDVQSAIAPVLAWKWGIQILSQWHGTSDTINFSGQSGFTLQVQTTRDYGQLNDVRSIIDGEIYNTAGMTGLQSNIAVTKLVQTPGGPSLLPSGYTVDPNSGALIPKQSQGIGDWLSNNWPWLALAGAGVIAAKELI